jgi:hypothetical protein
MIKYALMIALTFGLAGFASANTEKASAKQKQQDMNFEDLLVSGQYHFSDEAVTTVEEDKVLNSLIGVRADFKDRMKQSATLGEVRKK